MQTYIPADLTLSLTRAFASSTPALTNFQSGQAPLASLPREKVFAGVRPQSTPQPSLSVQVSYAAGQSASAYLGRASSAWRSSKLRGGQTAPFLRRGAVGWLFVAGAAR